MNRVQLTFCIYYRVVYFNIVFCFRFFFVSSVIVYIYFQSFQGIDEDDFGGFSELVKEGCMTSFAGFLVSFEPPISFFFFGNENMCHFYAKYVKILVQQTWHSFQQSCTFGDSFLHNIHFQIYVPIICENISLQKFCTMLNYCVPMFVYQPVTEQVWYFKSITGLCSSSSWLNVQGPAKVLACLPRHIYLAAVCIA